jgi:hypothetical protein
MAESPEIELENVLRKGKVYIVVCHEYGEYGDSNVYLGAFWTKHNAENFIKKIKLHERYKWDEFEIIEDKINYPELSKITIGCKNCGKEHNRNSEFCSVGCYYKYSDD